MTLLDSPSLASDFSMASSEYQYFRFCRLVHGLEDHEEGLVVAIDFVRRPRRSLREQTQQVCNELHAPLNHPALDSPLILPGLFLLLAPYFRRLVLVGCVHWSLIPHHKTPSFLSLDILLS
jgi:hypothetical protein